MGWNVSAVLFCTLDEAGSCRCPSAMAQKTNKILKLVDVENIFQ